MTARPPGPSAGEADAAFVAELARSAAVEASRQGTARTARVDISGDSAVAQVLLLDGIYATVWLERKWGRWSVAAIDESR